VVFFTFFFGALDLDIVEFAALLGLAECLNAWRDEPAPDLDEMAALSAAEEQVA
jgi:hypothetical protein